MIHAAWKEFVLTPAFPLGTSKGTITARTVWYLFAWDSARPHIKRCTKSICPTPA